MGRISCKRGRITSMDVARDVWRFAHSRSKALLCTCTNRPRDSSTRSARTEGGWKPSGPIGSAVSPMGGIRSTSEIPT